jgi:hypothetical protein
MRRLVGIAVLLLALVGIVAVNQREGHRVPGHPVADWPQPPPVGSCLDVDGDNPRTVPCSGPHDAEVTRTFGPLDPMATAVSQDRVYDACRAAAPGNLGPAAGGTPVPGRPTWDYLPLAYTTRPLAAPPDQRAGRYGWEVCVVSPAIPVRYRGTVQHVPVTDAPAAYRTCLDSAGQPVSCVLPHAQEVLAALNSSAHWGWQPIIRIGAQRAAGPGLALQPGSADSREQQQMAALAARLAREQAVATRSSAAGWLDECVQLARTLADTDDPTYGGLVGFGVGPVDGTVGTIAGTVTVVVQGTDEPAPDPGADGLPPSSSMITVTPPGMRRPGPGRSPARRFGGGPGRRAAAGRWLTASTRTRTPHGSAFPGVDHRPAACSPAADRGR